MTWSKVEGANWVWVVIFIPGQSGDYPSVCLPGNSPQTTTPLTTTTPVYHHHHLQWSLPGLHPFYDPLFDPFLSSFIYEPALGWFRSSKGKVFSQLFQPLTIKNVWLSMDCWRRTLSLYYRIVLQNCLLHYFYTSLYCSEKYRKV